MKKLIMLLLIVGLLMTPAISLAGNKKGATKFNAPVTKFIKSSKKIVKIQNLAERLKGKILLQVQDKGKAWYINPDNKKRYYLGRPKDAFDIMRKSGLGITNADLNKIPKNTDKFSGDWNMRKRLSGKILLQVQSRGEAWYINPDNLKRYYLGRPADAFKIMSNLGLGITNSDLNKISKDVLK